MLSKMPTEMTSKVLSKKKVPSAPARKKVDVRLNTTRFKVAHADILKQIQENHTFLVELGLGTHHRLKCSFFSSAD